VAASAQTDGSDDEQRCRVPGRCCHDWPCRKVQVAAIVEISNKHKHLDYIQGAINRMSGNLFLLKGWTITLIAALFALSAKDSNKAYVLVAYFPAIVFWILDAYFLSQERRFRALYDHVRTLPEEKIDFSMDTRPFQDEHTWLDAMYSKTLVVYYGALVLIMFAIMWIIR
jgi:hypothetical protein